MKTKDLIRAFEEEGIDVTKTVVQRHFVYGRGPWERIRYIAKGKHHRCEWFESIDGHATAAIYSHHENSGMLVGHDPGYYANTTKDAVEQTLKD